jgi:hypothetical protein
MPHPRPAFFDHLPAEVRTVTWADGQTLSADQTVVVLQTTIKFAQQPPVAVGGCKADVSGCSVSIHPLHCTHPAYGSGDCTLELLWYSQGGGGSVWMGSAPQKWNIYIGRFDQPVKLEVKER